MQVKKKLFFLIVLICGTISAAQAQFLEGTKTAGGGINYSTTSNRQPNGTGDQLSNFNLKLKGGYFVQDQLEAGLQLGLDSRKQEWDRNNNNIDSFSRTTFIIGPYARFYNPLTEVVAIFGEAEMQLGFGGGSNSNQVEYNVRTFSIGVRPGVSLMVNENLGLETSIGFIGYQHEAIGREDDFENTRQSTGTFRAGFNLSDISLGFRLYLTD